MTDITIQTAAEDDAAMIAALAKEIWTQHYLPIIGQAQIDYMLDNLQSESAIRRDIAAGYTYYIAFSGNTPYGYSAIKQDKGVFLSKFYVRQAHRGKGAGRAMLDAIRAYAKKHDAARIWLTCNKHNTASLQVYQRLGFTVIDSIVTDIGGGFVMDDYVLELQLG